MWYLIFPFGYNLHNKHEFGGKYTAIFCIKNMNIIQETFISLFGAFGVGIDRWASDNCRLCHTMGPHKPDTRKRGGIRLSSDGGVGYHCFNCGYSTMWQPGMHFGEKMIRLAEAYGAAPDQTSAMVLYAIELIESGITYEGTSTKLYQDVQAKPLPENSHPLFYWANLSSPPSEFLRAISEISNRNPLLLDLDLYWSPSRENGIYNRFIIPYIANGKPVGYTARSIYQNSSMRFYNSFPSNILFNYDLLNSDTVNTIYVFEAPIDALLMGVVATSSQTMSDYQLDLLNRVKGFGKRIVVVPDRDRDGKKMALQAIANGFDLSLPEYGLSHDNKLIKDPEEATRKYGRMLVKCLINNSTTNNEFEAKVMVNKWF